MYHPDAAIAHHWWVRAQGFVAGDWSFVCVCAGQGFRAYWKLHCAGLCVVSGVRVVRKDVNIELTPEGDSA